MQKTSWLFVKAWKKMAKFNALHMYVEFNKNKLVPKYIHTSITDDIECHGNYEFIVFVQVDNPVSVLNQDTSRNFLNSSDPKDKYKVKTLSAHIFFLPSFLIPSPLVKVNPQVNPQVSYLHANKYMIILRKAPNCGKTLKIYLATTPQKVSLTRQLLLLSQQYSIHCLWCIPQQWEK